LGRFLRLCLSSCWLLRESTVLPYMQFLAVFAFLFTELPGQ
jgi:hypothetical protein